LVKREIKTSPPTPLLAKERGEKFNPNFSGCFRVASPFGRRRGEKSSGTTALVRKGENLTPNPSPY